MLEVLWWSYVALSLAVFVSVSIGQSRQWAESSLLEGLMAATVWPAILAVIIAVLILQRFKHHR